MSRAEYDKKRYQEIKSDPVKYADFLARKRRELNARAKRGTEKLRKAKWRAKNPEHNKMLRLAHRAVEAAVKKGRITRPLFCQHCGKFAKVEAHHHLGYEPRHFLDVEWLCPPCHRKADCVVNEKVCEV